MSRLIETRRAYDKLVELLDQEIRNRRGSANDLERFRESLDVAFYLLGWGQFEYLVREHATESIELRARTRTVDRHAWLYLEENVKSLSVRRRLDLIFHGDDATRNSLDKEYTVRNDAAHNYRLLPPEAKDVSAWLMKLEDLVGKF